MLLPLYIQRVRDTEADAEASQVDPRGAMDASYVFAVSYVHRC
jgi:hypothetical protein